MEANNKIREDVLQSVSMLSDEQLNKHVEEGKWTIMQVLEHLYLMESGIVNGMMHSFKQEEDKSTEKKPIHLTVNRSTKVRAPAHFVPTEEFITLEEMKKKLAASRQKLNDFVAVADQTKFEKRSFPHPVFGLMDISQWIPFIGLHEKRHLEQIEEIKSELGY